MHSVATTVECLWCSEFYIFIVLRREIEELYFDTVCNGRPRFVAINYVENSFDLSKWFIIYVENFSFDGSKCFIDIINKFNNKSVHN